MKKRILSTLLAMTMTASAFAAAPAAAESTVDGDGYTVNFVYVVSGTLADQDKVNAALSELAL